jgi:hypothetical protein
VNPDPLDIEAIEGARGWLPGALREWAERGRLSDDELLDYCEEWQSIAEDEHAGAYESASASVFAELVIARIRIAAVREIITADLFRAMSWRAYLEQCAADLDAVRRALGVEVTPPGEGNR